MEEGKLLKDILMREDTICSSGGISCQVIPPYQICPTCGRPFEDVPCEGNGTCCNRPLFDRTIFPCKRIKFTDTMEGKG